MDEDEVFQEHITVHLTGCKYVRDFRERIKVSFEFPEFAETRAVAQTHKYAETGRPH